MDKIRIRDKHPGSATLVQIRSKPVTSKGKLLKEAHAFFASPPTPRKIIADPAQAVPDPKQSLQTTFF
jgi:hypothetical protein